MDYGSLIEYLISVRDGDANLCTLGYLDTRIDTFPPGFELDIETLPFAGSYATVMFLSILSPAIVPDAFRINAYHRGLTVQAGLLSEMGLRAYSLWIEITANEPLHTIWTNVSGLVQSFEVGNGFLMIASESKYAKVLEIKDRWGNKNILPEIQYTNQLLRDLVLSQGGTPAPRPPIGGQ